MKIHRSALLRTAIQFLIIVIVSIVFMYALTVFPNLVLAIVLLAGLIYTFIALYKINSWGCDD